LFKDLELTSATLARKSEDHSSGPSLRSRVQPLHALGPLILLLFIMENATFLEDKMMITISLMTYGNLILRPECTS